MEQEDEIEEVEEQEEDEQQDDDTQAVEAEARSMGWVPKDEFRGPENQWRDASEFVERGNTVLPIVQSLLKKERSKTSSLEAKIEKMSSDFESKFARLSQMSDLALTKQREQLESQFGAMKERAVETGDMDAYRAADKAEKDAIKDLETKSAPQEQKKGQDRPPAPPEVDEWVKDVGFQRWPQYMQAFAIETHETMLADKPGMSIEDNLSETLSAVKDKFPEKFGKKTETTRAAKVEGGSRGGGSSNGSAYSKLPKDAKAMCDSQVDLYLKPGETAEKDGLKAKERWAKVYFEQPGA